MQPRTLLLIFVAWFGISAQAPTPKEVQRGQTKELQQLIARANGGDAAAQYSLAQRYSTGAAGVPKDFAEAALWVRKAADQGMAKAQYALGMMYANGQGVMKDAAEAAKWVTKAADGGDPAAQNTLGVIYEAGQGVKQDDAEAAKWYTKAIETYRKAADEGDASAATALGNIYARGQGVTGDYSEAASWWRKAADMGYAGAQYNLGMAYERGRGVPEDRVQAYLWLSLSATGTGEEQARRAKARDTVVVGLTPEQRTEAKRLIEEWKPKAKTPAPAEAK